MWYAEIARILLDFILYLVCIRSSSHQVSNHIDRMTFYCFAVDVEKKQIRVDINYLITLIITLLRIGQIEIAHCYIV